MKYKKLKDLVEINSENINKNYKEHIINYLDTSNITKGKTNYKKSIVFLKKILKIFNIKNGITNKQILGIKSAGKIWQ